MDWEEDKPKIQGWKLGLDLSNQVKGGETRRGVRKEGGRQGPGKGMGQPSENSGRDVQYPVIIQLERLELEIVKNWESSTYDSVLDIFVSLPDSLSMPLHA